MNRLTLNPRGPTLDVTEQKNVAKQRVDECRPLLEGLAKALHANPETRFSENRAVGWICEILASSGYLPDVGIGGLETAFRARETLGLGGPAIAFLAEYDALPDLGHACGHNLIAAASVGAFLGVAALRGSMPGAVLILGTPGEEGGGGKTLLLDRQAFAGCDAALMFHPASFTRMEPSTLALADVTLTFYGKACHAASPEDGINALDGVIQTFNSLNALRSRMRPDARVHGIITRGGEARNVVPEEAQAAFVVRASDARYRDLLLGLLVDCAVGAAQACGARLEVERGGCREALTSSQPLARAFGRNLAELGEPVRKGVARPFSTDMGDVSHVLSAIHPTIAICDDDTRLHTRDFAAAAASPRGLEVMHKAAKALAATAIDALAGGLVRPIPARRTVKQRKGGTRPRRRQE